MIKERKSSKLSRVCTKARFWSTRLCLITWTKRCWRVAASLALQSRNAKSQTRFLKTPSKCMGIRFTKSTSRTSWLGHAMSKKSSTCNERKTKDTPSWSCSSTNQVLVGWMRHRCLCWSQILGSSLATLTLTRIELLISYWRRLKLICTNLDWTAKAQFYWAKCHKIFRVFSFLF